MTRRDRSRARKSPLWRTCLVTLACASALLGPADLAAAPAGCYMVEGGVVHDRRTKLTWQQGIVPLDVNWDEATAYCRNLNLQGGGWRLPTMKELQTIVDYTRSSPAIDADAFPGTPSLPFWTSSTTHGRPELRLLVFFGRGNTNGYLTTTRWRARCVR